MPPNEKKIFSGSANRDLAVKIARHLHQPLGKVDIRRFSDGEIWVKYNENIRGTDVFIVQPTHSPAENIVELLIMIDAARRASANRITAVIPYFGYARQDRKDQPRVSITAKLVSNLITTAGADRVLTMDLHAPQIQGFFDIPFDHLYSSVIVADHYRRKEIPNLVVVAPDAGGINMARAYAKRLNAGLVMVDKRRPEHNVAAADHIIGDVEGKNALIIDDMIDTGGTLAQAAEVLKLHGAQTIYAACTHAILSADAVRRIGDSVISKLSVTDTIAIPPQKRIGKIEVLSVAALFANAIDRIHQEESISSLFDMEK